MAEVVHIANIDVGPGQPLVLIAGPCVIEEEQAVLEVAGTLREICASLGLPLVFKSSFDKANRTSGGSYRGPGLEAGLAVLARVRATLGLPVTTDVHLPAQVHAVAQTVDLLQVPAFLCRQTDLLQACGQTGLPVNLKKGQFLAPWDMAYAVAKVREAGGDQVLVTERGTTFGYNDLVADFRSIGELGKLGVPVVFDATHAVQRPAAADGQTGGAREHIPTLARAAVAAGADALFLEIHQQPAQALSDAATQIALADAPDLLAELLAIAHAVGRPSGSKGPRPSFASKSRNQNN